MSFYPSPEAEASAVRRAARRVGARIASQGTRPLSGGPRAVGEVVCKDGWHAAQFLTALASEDARSPGARDLALFLRQGATAPETYARRVHSFVKDNVAFVREAGEVFQGAGYTLASGAGDCDDHARVTYALAEAGGLPARMAFLHERGGGPTHAVTQLYAGRPAGWAWAETTVDAAVGEHPFEAAQRLGLLEARTDLAKEVTVMSDRDLPPPCDDDATTSMGALTPNLTRRLSAAFFAKVQAMAERMRSRGADVQAIDLLAVWWFESRLNPARPNANGHPYYGLNQMGVQEMRAVGFQGTPVDWLSLSAEDQLPFIERYYEQDVAAFLGGNWSRLNGAEGLYLMNLTPAYAAHADEPDFVIFPPNTQGYRNNRVLDVDGKGHVEVADISKALAASQTSSAEWQEAVARLGEAGGEDETPAWADGRVIAGVGLLVATGALAAWQVVHG